MAFSVTDRK